MKSELCIVDDVAKLIKDVQPDLFNTKTRISFDDGTAITLSQTDFDFFEATKAITIDGQSLKLLF